MTLSSFFVKIFKLQILYDLETKELYLQNSTTHIV